ncbi:MAG: molybdenum cofactor guanylyltransferase MobA [Pseudomonadota bacterium]
MDDIPGVILAGGQSRRMGADKAFVMLGGQPLISHVIDRIAPQCASVTFNVNGDYRPFFALRCPVLSDSEFIGCGPLAGILTAMCIGALLGADRVLTVPVDTPFLPSDLLARLAAADAPIALAETSDGPQGTCGLWSVSLRDALRIALKKGTRKVTDWTGAQGATAVAFEDTTPPPFFNINRPEDLAQAEAYLRAPE